VECIIRNKIISSSSSDGTDESGSKVEILRLKGDTAIISEEKEDNQNVGNIVAEGNPRKRRVSEEEEEEEAEVDFNSLNHQLTRAISCHMSRRRLDGEQKDQAPSSSGP